MEHGRWSRGMLIEDEEGVEWILRKADTEASVSSIRRRTHEVAEWVQLHSKMWLRNLQMCVNQKTRRTR